MENEGSAVDQVEVVEPHGRRKHSRDCMKLPTASNFRDETAKTAWGKIQSLLKHDNQNMTQLNKLLLSISHDEGFLDSAVYRILLRQFYVLSEQFDPTVVESAVQIINLRPSSTKKFDHNKMLLLHYFSESFAVENAEQEERKLPILLALMTANPDSLVQENTFGETPLHRHVFQTQTSPIFLRAMLEFDPNCARKKVISSQKLPIHFLMEDTSEIELDSVLTLVQAYPQGIFDVITENIMNLRLNGSGHARKTLTWCPYDNALQMDNQDIAHGMMNAVVQMQLQRIGTQIVRKNSLE